MVEPPPAATAAALAAFAASGGTGTPLVVSAPGRINILGEHTDYNDGLCLPAAIDRGVVCAVAPRAGAAPFDGVELRLASDGHDPVPPVSVPPLPEGPGWLRLAGAVAMELDGLGVHPAGIVGGFGSDLPEGSGLSSSAAFEVAWALAMCSIAGSNVSPMALAAACRRAEAAGLGVPCGPLDQIASCLGVEGGALLLDCASLEVETVTLPRGGDGEPPAFVVVDSGIPRRLADSGYAQRVAECRAAAEMLGVPSLRSVGPADLAGAARRLPDLLLRRVRHVVTEIQRVRDAVETCRHGDGGAAVSALGSLMDESHRSLSADFEVSLPQIDDLVERCRAVPGVHGARIVGAGFGGSVLCLADGAPDATVAIAEAVAGGTAAGALVVRPSAGACPPA